MNTPAISLIIPVYNVEKYIRECLDSVLQQTFTDYEVILVDDGSTDKSIQIALETIQNDPHFLIFHKENGGQSSARNLGLRHARGKYVQFLDSDDTILPSMMADLHQLSETMNLDMCISAANMVTENGKFIKKISYPNLTVGRNNSREDLFLACALTNPVVWTILFRKDLFASHFFVEGRFYEDAELMHKLIHDATKFYYTDRAYYQYRQRMNSTTYAISSKKMSDFLYALSSIKNYKDSYIIRSKTLCDGFTRMYYDHAFLRLMAQAALQCESLSQYRKFSQESLEIMDKDIANLKTLFFMKNYSLYKKIQAILLLLSPSLSYLTYNFMEALFNRFKKRFA